MKQKVKRFFVAYLPVIAYCVIVFVMFRNVAGARQDYGQLSARYSEAPLAPAAVESARVWLNDPSRIAEYNVTFWAQEKSLGLTNAAGKTVQTPGMFVDGEMSAAMPAYFLFGDYPPATDKYGVAVSEGLAWELWGGTNLLGAELTWNGATYYVRGVFRSDDLMAVIQADPAALAAPPSGGGGEGQGSLPGSILAGLEGTGTGSPGGTASGSYTFEGVELAGDFGTSDPRETTIAYLNSMGLPEPTSVVNTNTFVGLLNALAWLPAAIIIVWFLVKLLGRVRKLNFWAKQLVWFGVLLGIALLVPFLLDQLPAWLIPTKWSDLEHWSRTFQELNSRLTEWFMLVPSAKDMALRKLLIGQVFLAVLGLFASTATIRNWNARMGLAMVWLLPGKQAAALPAAGEEAALLPAGEAPVPALEEEEAPVPEEPGGAEETPPPEEEAPAPLEPGEAEPPQDEQ